MDFIIQFCKKQNISKINLEVSSSNIIAINLYKKFDFKQVGCRKKYYNNEDGLLFTKYLWACLMKCVLIYLKQLIYISIALNNYNISYNFLFSIYFFVSWYPVSYKYSTLLVSNKPTFFKVIVINSSIPSNS